MSEVSKHSPSRSGTFEATADPLAEQFTQSIDLDRRLFREDIAGSIAHATMLAEQGIISPSDCQQIQDVLSEIEAEIEAGQFPFSAALEDIHMHIEDALVARTGDVGRKLHTARSRNDQVSTSMRLWIRNQLDRIDNLLADLQRAFVRRCDQDLDTILPAYTHLQRAQPVLAAHYWLAYCEKFQRDRRRVADCRQRVNQNPLGCGAVAGTSIDIDRHMTTDLLQFEGLMQNSLDASGDRDFLLESVFVCSLIGVHLSGWAEEWILWASDEFGMIELPQAFCTGSSMMPQKINPDCLELIRGKSSIPIGALQAVLVLVKGLPLAYNRDMQEDKRQLFAAFDAIVACLQIAQRLVAGAKLSVERVKQRLEAGFVDATSLMEFLIKRGASMRSAHHAVGELVKLAAKSGKTLSQLKLEDFKSIDSNLDNSVYSVLGVANAVRAFCSIGSTGREQVLRQLADWKVRLQLD